MPDDHDRAACGKAQSEINNAEMEADINAILTLATKLRDEWVGQGCPHILGTLMFHIEARVTKLTDASRAGRIPVPIPASKYLQIHITG